MTRPTESDDCADDEFRAADFGDVRLTQHLTVLERKIWRVPHCSFPHALDGADLKAAYRFFDNPKIDVKGVLEQHIGQALERVRQLPLVLVRQDTSEFNLAYLLATEGLGSEQVVMSMAL